MKPPKQIAKELVVEGTHAKEILKLFNSRLALKTAPYMWCWESWISGRKKLKAYLGPYQKSKMELFREHD